MEKEIIAFANLGCLSPAQEKEVITLMESLDKQVIKVDYTNDAFASIYNFGQTVITKKAHRGIVIDDYGSLPFMVLGKMKGSIVAQISDEHSAHMTSEHNGSNMITLGCQLSSMTGLKNIITKYLKTPFAAGRHLVRTDMLDEMLKQEGDVK